MNFYDVYFPNGKNLTTNTLLIFRYFLSKRSVALKKTLPLSGKPLIIIIYSTVYGINAIFLALLTAVVRAL